MKLVILSLSLIFTGCMSSGLGKTCDKFGQDVEWVKVKSIDSDTLGASQTVIEFKCSPRKYKVK